MGLGLHAIKWLELIRIRYNIDFTNTLTLGRQYCSVLQLKKTERSLKRIKNIRKIDIFQEDGYSEKLFSFLGVKNLDIMDYSDYEGANIIHDLNEPLPDELKDKYDVVLDGGTMEHVYNYPVALRNSMDAVCEGGVLILTTPTNNYCNHGFYQISPCMFMDILNKANGWQLLEISLFEERKLNLSSRLIRIIKDGQIYPKGYDLLFVVARKLGKTPDKIIVQQGDYEEIWNDSKGNMLRSNKLNNKIKKINRSTFIGEVLFKVLWRYIKYLDRKNNKYNIDKEIARLL